MLASQLIASLAEIITEHGDAPVRIYGGKEVCGVSTKDGGAAIGLEQPLVQTPIEELHINVRTFNALRRGGVESAEQLAGMTAGQVMQINGMGRLSLADLRAGLLKAGFVLDGDYLPAVRRAEDAGILGKSINLSRMSENTS